MKSTDCPDLSGGKLLVGLKQTRQAIETGKASKVFVAMDAEPRLVQPLVEACRKFGIPTEEVVSMRQLGAACGIHVGAAAAAILLK